MIRESLKNRIFFPLVLLLFILSLTLPVRADAVEIKRLTLANSLPLLQVERHNLPVVMVTLLIKASPLNEAKAGVANLTAAMLTEGTKTRTASEISAEIDFIGASLSATTNSDYTTISLSVLKKDVEKGFDLLSDVLLRPTFPEDELKRKKELIKGSLRQREEEPSFLAERAFIKEVFGGHPYGRLVEGSIESIDATTRDDLITFYGGHYSPDKATLSVVGDLTSEELASLMDRYFGQWKKGAPQESGGTSLSPDEVRANAQDVTRPRVIAINRDITQANIILGHPGIARGNPDYYAVSVMNYILGGGGFASRLMKVVRDDMGLAYSIYSSFAGNMDPGQFEVGVQTKNESAGTVIKEILRQMERMRSEPISDEELNDARAYLTGSFPRRLETSRKIADFLVAVQFYDLGDDYIEKYPEYIKSVTKEDVLRVARKYLLPDKYVLVVVGSDKQLKLPDL